MVSSLRSFFIFIILFVACDPSDKNDNEILYVISAGEHRSTPFQFREIFSTTSYNSEVKIVKGEYDHGNSDQADWNKLTGFSDCSEAQAFQGKGAMIGWRWRLDKKKIELAAYVHNDGSNKFHAREFVRLFDIGQEMSIRIAIDKNKYIFTIDGEEIIMEGDSGRGCEDKFIDGRIINPWFGGNLSAPTKIRIQVRYL